MERKEYLYIYNPVQAKYFANKGARIIEIGRGCKGDIYLKFEKNEELKGLYKMWVDRKYKD